jgi:phospholipase C
LTSVVVALTACASNPTASPTPPRTAGIKHVVIIIKENHSFDNYFGSLEDPVLQLPHCPTFTTQTRCQYTSTDIPAYYELAREFGYGDTYFTDIRGPSWPNDMMMIAGTTPLNSDPPLPLTTWICPTTCYDMPTIGDELTSADVTWRNYGLDLYDPFLSIRRYATDSVHNVATTNFFNDVAAGHLPAVSWIRPAPDVSEHPGYDIKVGEEWTVTVVDALMRSQDWRSTAIFITWDDAGSVPDHVAPPVLERTPSGQPLRYGYRVPLLVISPFTHKGQVSHRLLSHVSLLKFIEALFHLQSLTSRDRDAASPNEFFDQRMLPRAPVFATP